MGTDELTGGSIARGLGVPDQVRWPLRRSSDLFELRYGKALVASSRRPGPIPVYGTNGQTGTHDTVLFEGPGVIVGRKGAGHLGVHWTDSNFWVIDTAYSLCPKVEYDLKFAYYLVSHVGLNHLKHGTSNPSLTRDAFSAQYFPVPPIEAQRAIAATLGALDDKIESSRQIARVSLDLAEALYLDACSRGAETIPLKKAGRWLSGGTPSTTRPEYWGGDLPWISSASLKSFFVWSSDRCLTEAGEDAATNVVPAGTVLMVVRGMSLKSEFRFGVAQREVAFGQDCKAILPAVPAAVLAMALRSSREEILDLVDEAGHGTGRLSTDLIEQHRIQVPHDSPIIGVLDGLVARGALAEQESAQLAATRDALLPELLSGRLRVPETVA